MSSSAKIEIFAVVRDKNGRPKFDDLNTIPDAIFDSLTISEQQEVITQIEDKANGINARYNDS